MKGEEEVVSTSFSPRVHAYPGRPWPLDQPPGTPHKRPSALKNVKTSTVPELDPPSRRTVSVGRSKLGIQQDKSLALPYRRDDELVQRRPQRISESGAVKKPISRTSSFKRNLSSLTDVSASATLPPRGSTNVDLQVNPFTPLNPLKTLIKHANSPPIFREPFHTSFSPWAFCPSSSKPCQVSPSQDGSSLTAWQPRDLSSSYFLYFSSQPLQLSLGFPHLKL